MSLGRLQDISSRRLQDVLQDVLITSSRRFWKKSSRRLQDVVEDKKLLRRRRLEDQQMFSWKYVCNDMTAHYGYEIISYS